MHNYRAIVQYHFKKGMEAEGIRFLENELIKKAKEYGCHTIELCHCERDPTLLIGIASWDNLEEAKRFQSTWGAKEREIMRFCSAAPHHEFFRLQSSYKERAPKAA
jgi:hypothetical protein